MKNLRGTGLVYRGDEKSWSVYDMWFEDRVVFEAAVDNEDPELKIYVGRRGATFAQVWSIEESVADLGGLLVTTGRARKGPHEVGGTPESPGDLKDHVDGTTIQSYVYPRITRILADLYVPKTPTPVKPTSANVSGIVAAPLPPLIPYIPPPTTTLATETSCDEYENVDETTENDDLGPLGDTQL